MSDSVPSELSPVGPVAAQVQAIAEDKVITHTKAFFDDGDGLCFWCPDKAITDWCGVPLCEKHWGEEQVQMQRDMGVR